MICVFCRTRDNSVTKPVLIILCVACVKQKWHHRTFGTPSFSFIYLKGETQRLSDLPKFKRQTVFKPRFLNFTVTVPSAAAQYAVTRGDM